jgi:hypothetical protein
MVIQAAQDLETAEIVRLVKNILADEFSAPGNYLSKQARMPAVTAEEHVPDIAAAWCRGAELEEAERRRADVAEINPLPLPPKQKRINKKPVAPTKI